MIGNDVIDLKLARQESNWKRKGFLDKLFTKKEQALIFSSETPEIMVWNLWSRKEAVYKIFNRESGFRGFIPLRMECFFDSETFGRVTLEGKNYFTQTKIAPEFIHTIAVSAKENFANLRAVGKENVVKINGLPFCARSKNPATISHHGQFERIVTLR